MDRGECFQNKVVAGAQMSALVGEDGRDFRIAERVQRSFADHHPAAYPGQTVGKRLRHVQDAKVSGPGARVGKGSIVPDPDEIDHHAVVGPTAPSADGHPHQGDRQPGTDQHSQREDGDVRHPQRPAQTAGVADESGRGPPVGTGH